MRRAASLSFSLREPHSESTSSMKMMEGLCCLASSNRFFTSLGTKQGMGSSFRDPPQHHRGSPTFLPSWEPHAGCKRSATPGAVLSPRTLLGIKVSLIIGYQKLIM